MFSRLNRLSGFRDIMLYGDLGVLQLKCFTVWAAFMCNVNALSMRPTATSSSERLEALHKLAGLSLTANMCAFLIKSTCKNTCECLLTQGSPSRTYASA